MENAADSHFWHWLIEAPLGLLLIGAALSVFGQSVIYKSRGESLRKWFWWGTLSLVIFNAGICVFGDAVRHRVLYELSAKTNAVSKN
jgi:hypothetical protein